MPSNQATPVVEPQEVTSVTSEEVPDTPVARTYIAYRKKSQESIATPSSPSSQEGEITNPQPSVSSEINLDAPLTRNKLHSLPPELRAEITGASTPELSPTDDSTAPPRTRGQKRLRSPQKAKKSKKKAPGHDLAVDSFINSFKVLYLLNCDICDKVSCVTLFDSLFLTAVFNNHYFKQKFELRKSYMEHMKTHDPLKRKYCKIKNCKYVKKKNFH